jgi:hypothetical protein
VDNDVLQEQGAYVAIKFRWLAAVAAAAAVVVTSGAVAAQAAPAPGWRISAVYPEDSGVGGIVAASANSAWALENCTRPCHTGHDGYTLRHWNGTQWQVVNPVPAHEVGGSISQLALAPGAKSEPWAFYSYKTYSQTAVARWTGKSWSAPTLLANHAGIRAVVSPSSGSIWAFGFTGAGRPYTVRYNGRSWSAAPSPGVFVLSASAASPTDIWVIGTKIGAAKGTWPMAVSHWNGKKWTTTELPRVPVPPKSKGVGPLSIVAGGADSAWALGYAQGPDGSIVPNDGMILYHWNGAKWSAVAFPYKESQAFSISPDGQGGIVLWDEVDPGHHDYLVHASASGHWSEVTVPRPADAFSAQIYSIEPIPGTTSLWASGIASVPIPVGGNPGGTEGLILKYGA